MKRVIIAIILLNVTLSADTPLQVVQRVRGKYPNLPGNRPITNQALREIAADKDVKGGIYKKSSGNNCVGFSCDVICFKDGRYADVFIDWENTARASWQMKTGIDPNKCELQGVTNPPPNCPACPTCPPASDCAFEKAEIVKLSQALAELQKKYDNVKCTTPSYLGWHPPCTVVK